MIKITSLVRRSTGLSHSEWDGVIGWIETGMERWRERYGDKDDEWRWAPPKGHAYRSVV